jgi:undecaprenyl-diphosphatase
VNWIHALLLGIIQGLTEFLPVSSSGHLVIFQKLLGILEHSLELDIVVHLGTLFAILTYYRRDLMSIAMEAAKGASQRKMFGGLRIVILIVVASVPTAFIGLVFRNDFKNLFSNLTAVGGFLCITGFLLLLTRKKKQGSFSLEKMDITKSTISIKQALTIGIAQGLAIAPGISRSGSTIAIALLCGISRAEAARFSFFLSIPAVAGAALLELRDVNLLNTASSYLWIGFFTSYLVGLVGLIAVVKIVHHGKIHLFSGYLFIVGVLTVFFGLRGV